MTIKGLSTYVTPLSLSHELNNTIRSDVGLLATRGQINWYRQSLPPDGLEHADGGTTGHLGLTVGVKMLLLRLFHATAIS